jgi:hypothetical protein
MATPNVLEMISAIRERLNRRLRDEFDDGLDEAASSFGPRLPAP